MNYQVTIENDGRTFSVPAGTVLLDVLQTHDLHPDAPCGGVGKCKKCTVTVNGQQVLSCQTVVDQNMTVALPKEQKAEILTDSLSVAVTPDGTCEYALAFDLGTTTVVAYLLDGHSGALAAQASCMNPQSQFGADVISRIQYAMDGGAEALSSTIRSALVKLTREVSEKAGIASTQIGIASLVGNTAMHHLLLGIDPKPLTVPPYMPNVFEALTLKGADYLPIGEDAVLRILPNIAGFVGADTVGCMLSTRFDKLEELTLMIDIGTNGEMVLGDKNRRIACSTAAGPAFEGAKIQCGMRGAPGAIDKVFLQDGKVSYHVIGEEKAVGICGSGLLDLVATLLRSEDLDESGRLEEGTEYMLEGCEVFLSQKDIREVQLAKAAIRAGIELMCRKLNVKVEDIQKVYLAGAFGNYLDPKSACTIGMIPPILLERIQPIGNAAGEGAKLASLREDEFLYSQSLAKNTEFLELASMEEFNDCYVDCLMFEEEE